MRDGSRESQKQKSLFLLGNRLFQFHETYSSVSEEPRKQIATDLHHQQTHLSSIRRQTYIRLAEVADAVGEDHLEEELLPWVRGPNTVVAVCYGLRDRFKLAFEDTALEGAAGYLAGGGINLKGLRAGAIGFVIQDAVPNVLSGSNLFA